MTGMGFGLNVGPKIMSHIVAQVLSLDEKVFKGTGHDIDYIIVNEDIVSALQVKKHLDKYGLKTKEPKSLSSACVLGLRLKLADDGSLVWERDCDLLTVESEVTKRGLYSLCVKYIGHYPVAR